LDDSHLAPFAHAQAAASIYAHGQAGEDLTHASGVVVVLPPTITVQRDRHPTAGIDGDIVGDDHGTAPFHLYVGKKEQQSFGKHRHLTLANVGQRRPMAIHADR